MSNRQIGKTAKELIAAKKRISNPDDWYPEHGDPDLIPSFGESIDGKRLCAIRALWRTNGKQEAYDMLLQEARSMGVETIIHINARGHDAVMTLYDRAINKAIRQGK